MQALDASKELNRVRIKSEQDLHDMHLQIENKIENSVAQLLVSKTRPETTHNHKLSGVDSFTQTDDVVSVAECSEEPVHIGSSSGCQNCEYYLEQNNSLILSAESLGAEHNRAVLKLQDDLNEAQKSLQDAKGFVLRGSGDGARPALSLTDPLSGQQKPEPGSLGFLKELLGTMNEHVTDIHAVAAAIPSVYVDQGTNPIEELLQEYKMEEKVGTGEAGVQTEPVETPETEEHCTIVHVVPEDVLEAEKHSAIKETDRVRKSKKAGKMKKKSSELINPVDYSDAVESVPRGHQSRSSMDSVDFAEAIGSTLEMGSLPSVENMYQRATGPLDQDDLSDVDIKEVMSHTEVSIRLIISAID